MVRLENLVSKDHPYSTYIKLLDFRFLHKKLLPLEVEDRYKGYGIIKVCSNVFRYNLWKISPIGN